jgi:hypothetical protein
MVAAERVPKTAGQQAMHGNATAGANQNVLLCEARKHSRNSTASIEAACASVDSAMLVGWQPHHLHSCSS